MITKYKHHGREVFVQEELKGKHRGHCLCWKCKKLKINQPDNCPIAQLLFETCQKHGLVTPVYECPVFDEKK